MPAIHDGSAASLHPMPEATAARERAELARRAAARAQQRAIGLHDDACAAVARAAEMEPRTSARIVKRQRQPQQETA
jgi:hypothetical protein